MAGEGSWIAWPVHGVAYVLRSAAGVLDAAASLAERAVGAPVQREATPSIPDPADASAETDPLGTRERIAATLRRARDQYDVVTAMSAPPPGARGRTGAVTAAGSGAAGSKVGSRPRRARRPR